MPRKKYSSVSLPLPLIRKVQKKIKNTGFKSTSDYVTFVLREILADAKKNESFSNKDRKNIRERLKVLGYL